MPRRKTKTERAAKKSGKLIRQKKLRLRRRIADDPGLQRDFNFLVECTHWPEEKLLSFLFWDCNMMSADVRSVIARRRREAWPVEESTLRRAINRIFKIAEQIQKINGTDLSPTRTIFFSDQDGEPLTARETKQRRAIFENLPEILRTYASELQRKAWLEVAFWRREKPNMELIVQMSRMNSLYEHIRSATGGYHQHRLHRLVNAARVDQGLPTITQRAFTVWLNRLKKRHQATHHNSTLT